MNVTFRNFIKKCDISFAYITFFCIFAINYKLNNNMEKLTIQDLRDRGWIVYEYMRGSHAYGLAIEGQSDIDIGGVFVIPQSYLMGLRSNYIEQVADEKNDTVFYEFGRWIELLLKSNPSALESLFIPKQCIIGEPHPMIQYIIDNRDSFLSKECIKTTCGYALLAKPEAHRAAPHNCEVRRGWSK
jgi:predicted nucleotidyltransferase